MPTPNPKQPGKLRRWRRRLVFLGGALLLLLAAGFALVTRSAFITGIALPMAGGLFHANLTAKSAELKSLSSLELHDLDLTLYGGEPILHADRVKVLFSPRRIAGGTVAVQEALVVSPVVRLVRKADGSWNIDPLLAGSKRKPREPRLKKTGPIPLDIHNVALVNATIDLTIEHTNSPKETLHLTGVSLALDQIRTGQPVKIALGFDAKFERAGPGEKSRVLARAKLALRQELVFDEDFMPKYLRGSTKLDLPNASGIWEGLTGASLLMDNDLTPAEVAKFHARFSRDGAILAEMSASGPFDVLRQRGRLSVDLSGMDQRLLELAEGPGGLDIHDAAASLHQEIEMAGRPGQVRETGLLHVAQLSVAGGPRNLPTPVLDLTLGYTVAADIPAQNARIEKFALAGSENGVPFLTTTLSQPMTVSWGAGIEALEDAAISVSITNLDFAEWRPLAGRALPKGRLDASLKLASSRGQKELAGDVSARFRDAAIRRGTNQISGVEVVARVKGRLENLLEATLDEYRIEVSVGGRAAADVSGSGSYNLRSGDAGAAARINADLPAAMKLFPVEGISIAEGRARIEAKLAAGSFPRVFSARAVLTNFTGAIKGVSLGRAALTADAAGQWSRNSASLSRCKANLEQSGGETARLELTGGYNWETKAGQAKVLAEGSLPRVFEAWPVEALKLSAGSLKFNGSITTSGSATRAAGTVAVRRLVGTIAGAVIPETDLDLETSARVGDETFKLAKLSGSITENGRAAGRIDVAGEYGLANHRGEIDATAGGLNELVLGPFFTLAFPGRNLVSASVDSRASVRWEAGGSCLIQGEGALTNLVCQDLKTGKAGPALRAEILLDADARGTDRTLRRLHAVLPPTARATNILEIEGKLDLSKLDQLAGNLQVRSELFDGAPILDFWLPGLTNIAPKGKAAPAKPGAEEREPDAVQLPFRDVSARLEIGKLLLHEMTATNFSLTARARGDMVDLSSLRCSLNGAPLEARGSMDFSVPGYKYDLALHTDKLPVAPVTDTFAPEERGQYQGVVIADARLSAAGFSGAHFKHSLAGDLSVEFTNTDFRVIGPKLRIILLPIALVLRIPEILNSPLHELRGRAHFAGGNMQVEEVSIQAEAFAGRVAGVVPLAKSLGDSPLLNFPVDFMLARVLAKRSDLLPANVPPTAAYVKLPNFIKLKGTLGNPKSDISEFGIAHILFDSTTGIFTKPAWTILKSAQHVLTGGAANSRTNAPATAPDSPPPGKPKN